MKDYKWILRKGSRKDRCPQCGKLRFVPYVLAADPTVKAGPEYGRCDREQSCGYFRYPGGEVRTDSDRECVPEPPKEPILLPRDVMDYIPGCGNSLLNAYMWIVGWQLTQIGREYMLGTGSHGECIYYQYDGTHVRTAKAILYGTDGHRIKVED